MFRQGDQVAAIVLEPVLGNAGMILGSREYLETARQLASRFGACFILDEIVTGFRVRPGPMWEVFGEGVRPDLIVLGKAISGGMPFAALCGSRHWFASANKSRFPRVLADLGTFTAHPGTLACALQELRQLLGVPPEAYAAVCERMAILRSRVETTLARNDIPCAATGRSYEPDVPDFPIGTVRYAAAPVPPIDLARNPNVHWDATVVDVLCRTTISKILLLLEGVYSWQGLGVLSLVHTEADVQRFASAYEAIAPRLAVILRSLRP
jgi:glutamate-1-semialdehyde 2,1-aminomutase